MRWSNTAVEVRGSLEGDGQSLPLRVSQVRPHSLVVQFDDPLALPQGPTRFERLRLSCEGQEINLGPCQFDARDPKRRRVGDPAPEPGDGRVLFDRAVYDFRMLFKNGRVTDLGQRIEQLPVVLARQGKVRPAFRLLVSELRYDFQVFRAVFDDLDRNLEGEPESVREAVRGTAVVAHYPHFCKFFDARLAMLQDEVKSENRETHAVHGFFLRKQMWDLIASSEFLLRTNLKPRGYAGDSQVLRMIYEDEFRGGNVFGRFLHRHPLGTALGQAVRSRRTKVAQAIAEAHVRVQPKAVRARVLSVGCGPAWELREVFTGPQAFSRYELVLTDHDDEALEEASDVVAALEAHYASTADVRLEHDSARTMLSQPDPTVRWGRYDLVYASGLLDTLTQPVARAILSKLYRLLVPGGELLLSSFPPSHPARTYMEYWMDWVLLYRTEEELAALAAGLAGAQVSVSFDQERTQLFLKVQRT